MTGARVLHCQPNPPSKNSTDRPTDRLIDADVVVADNARWSSAGGTALYDWVSISLCGLHELHRLPEMRPMNLPG